MHPPSHTPAFACTRRGMHQLVMYDAFFSKSKRQDFGVFSLDDIDGAFAANRWVLLNYSQQYTLPPLPGASASTADVELLPPVLTAGARNGHAAAAGCAAVQASPAALRSRRSLLDTSSAARCG